MLRKRNLLIPYLKEVFMKINFFKFVFIFRQQKITFFAIHFRTKYLKPADSSYGHLSLNGTLHGLLRMVNKSEADVSVDVFDFNTVTGTFVEYLPAVWKFR